MGVHLSGDIPADPSQPKGILEMIRDGLAELGGIGDVLAGVVTGIVGGLVGAVQGIADLIGGLFSAGRRDTAAVDQARVDGENAIAERMGLSLDKVDEVQRFGGAFMNYPMFRIDNGETAIDVLPLTEMLPLEVGVKWIPRNRALTHSAGYRYFRNTTNAEFMARASGQLELAESGLWQIYFQAGLLQGGDHPNRPVDVWCHVSDAESPWLPVGPPGMLADGTAVPGEQMARHRETGVYQRVSDDFLMGYGRAGAYVRTRDTGVGGGNTVSGMMHVNLPSAGWKISLSCWGWERHGGAATTFVHATKVNSQTLRDAIEDLQDDIADVIPGHNVDKLLDEGAIAAMVAEADGIDVLNGEPDE